MDNALYLIPLFPLAGFLLNGLLLGRLSKKLISFIACGSVGLSFIFGVKFFLDLLSLPEQARVIENIVFTWIPSGQFHANIAFLLDPDVSALVVSGNREEFQWLLGGMLLREQSERSCLEIITLAVDAPCRRQGIGRSLMAFAEDAARSKKVRTLSTILPSPDAGTEAFLREAGFRPEGIGEAAEVHQEDEDNQESHWVRTIEDE